MKLWLLVGAGGFLGAMARYGLGGWVQARAGAGFGWGTLAVNLLGCLAIGLIWGIGERQGSLSPEAGAFLMVGILGGFTTFSAFGLELFLLLRSGAWPVALAVVLSNLLLGLGAVWLGWESAGIMRP